MGEGNSIAFEDVRGARRETVSVNGLKLQSYLWGSPDAPPLLLVHGHMDSGLTFDGVAKRLQDRYFCIAPDLRGYGASDHTRNSLGYFMVEHVADLYALARHYGNGAPVRMVGHSFGGNLALIFAGTFPTLVSHVASLDAYGFVERDADAGPERLRRWVLETQREPVGLPRYRNEAAYFRRQQKRYPRVDPALDRKRHECMLRRSGSEEIHSSADPKHQWSAPDSPRLSELAVFWRRISASCLLVIAEDSELKRWVEGDAANSQLDARLKLLPEHARTVRMPECGHLLHLEKPAALSALLREFLQ